MSRDRLSQFLDEFETDAADGAARSVDDYVARYPEIESQVREHCARAGANASLTAPHVPATESSTDSETFPRQVGRYEIMEPIGKGGMGTILLAWDPKLGGEVVLKTMRGIKTWATPVMLQRFEREARIGRKLNHDGICQVYDLLYDGDNAYVVMPRIEGRTLSDAIRAAREHRQAHPDERNVWATFSVAAPDSQFASQVQAPGTPAAEHTATGTTPTATVAAPGDLRTILRLMEKIAGAVHRAHQEGVIHRDLKPDNIMIRPNGDPIVLDFGLAVDLKEESGPRLSYDGDVFGTPAYMAPEQALGRLQDIGPHTDVYALGVILYELLTLQRPFRGPNARAVIDRVLKGNPVPPRRLDPQLPRDLEAVCLRAMESRPADRIYASAQEFADDLRNVRTLQTTRARPLSLWQRGLRTLRKHPKAVGGLALSLTAVLFLIGLLMVEEGDRSHWVKVRLTLQSAREDGIDSLSTEQRSFLEEHVSETARDVLFGEPTSPKARAILERYWDDSLTRGSGDGPLQLQLRGVLAESGPEFRFAVPTGDGEVQRLQLQIEGPNGTWTFPFERAADDRAVATFRPPNLSLATGEYTWWVELADEDAERRRRGVRWEYADIAVVPPADRDALLAEAREIAGDDAWMQHFLGAARLLREGFAQDALRRLDALPEAVRAAGARTGDDRRWDVLRGVALAQLGRTAEARQIRDGLR